jgi:ribonuclease P protein component
VRGDKFLTRKIQFTLVFEEGRSWAGKEIVVRALPNGLGISRFGFVVSRRVGKAVIRNRVKRKLREIMRQTQVTPGWDIILVARVPAGVARFVKLNQSVRKLLVRAGLLMGENEGFGVGTD